MKEIHFEKWNYDKSNPKAIEEYAKALLGKSFQDVIDEDTEIINENRTADKKNKGSLGQILEERFFHYPCNNDSRPDFPEAGVELKVSPYKQNKNGSYSAKERLVLSKINYVDIVNEDFETGHFWNKSKLILLVYYLYQKDLRSVFYKINYVSLFTPPAQDLVIIRNDYEIIVNKIRLGFAHQLSERDTMYLSACTKGAKSTDRTIQPYSDIPAKPRAFSFKPAYMTYVLNNYIIPGKETYEAAFSTDELSASSFEVALKNRLLKYVGMTESEIEKQLSLSINKKNKSYQAILGCKMLGVRSNRVEEFVKAGIITKIIKFNNQKSDNQQFRIEDFKIKDLDNEAFDTDIIDEETGEYAGWESSELYNLLKNRKYMFLVFWEEADGIVFKGSQLWGMSDDDIEKVREVWQRVKVTVREGVQLVPHKKGNKIEINNNLPGIADNGIFHIRNHASKTYYELKNGQKYGSGTIGNSDVLPNGERMTKQAYWLNRSYIESQLDEGLVMKYK